MKINCVWEHNGEDSLLYFADYIGAYSRGSSLEEALTKAEAEIKSYCSWCGKEIPQEFEFVTAQEKLSELKISDADSDVLFESEIEALSFEEYNKLKSLALKSASDFLLLYHSVPEKEISSLPVRKSFYGAVPRTAEEMYQHTKSVNEYYFSEINVEADNHGDIFECRKKGFELLETNENFLENRVFEGSYGELWSLRKVIRRFIWHDRIHAKAMFRMALRTFGEDSVDNPFCF